MKSHVCKHPGCFASLVLGARVDFCTYHNTKEMSRWRDAMAKAKRMMRRAALVKT